MEAAAERTTKTTQLLVRNSVGGSPAAGDNKPRTNRRVPLRLVCTMATALSHQVSDTWCDKATLGVTKRVVLLNHTPRARTRPSFYVARPCITSTTAQAVAAAPNIVCLSRDHGVQVMARSTQSNSSEPRASWNDRK